MIDSSKKQQQGFPEILLVGDIESLKEKECLDTNSQKSLKEGEDDMDVLAKLLISALPLKEGGCLPSSRDQLCCVWAPSAEATLTLSYASTVSS
ncbi:hypothetical protein lerEdw1_002295 [Lerista edwardsae]|nr:hypothetical protein lerEdw1_002295 [Lerista edwardsae]